MQSLVAGSDNIFPQTKACPDVGVVSPVRIFIVVLLPAPFTPRKTSLELLLLVNVTVNECYS